jgi:putative PIN family toxin of toxin-antitoxin system
VRVVIDTGVVVSALVFRAGRVTWLRDRWTAGALLPRVSRATVEELIRVLAYPKFRLSRHEIDVVLSAYVPHTEGVVAESSEGEEDLPPCDDPDDVEFLRLALHGRAEALITGDDDLLRLGKRSPFPILTPAQFKDRLP